MQKLERDFWAGPKPANTFLLRTLFAILMHSQQVVSVFSHSLTAQMTKISFLLNAKKVPGLSTLEHKVDALFEATHRCAIYG